MLLIGRLIGWFLTRFVYRWVGLLAMWLIILVLLYPALALGQWAHDTYGQTVGWIVMFAEFGLLLLAMAGAWVIIFFTAGRATVRAWRKFSPQDESHDAGSQRDERYRYYNDSD